MERIHTMAERSFRKTRLTSSVATAVNIGTLVPSLTRRKSAHARSLGVLIPGDGVLETTVVGGTANFFAIYQNVLLLRIVLTWFPAVNNAPIVRPLITVCDPYLNLFRNVIPPLFGSIDLSPVLALILLQAFGSATMALGAEMPKEPATGQGNARRSQVQRRGPWGAMVRSLRERGK